MSEAGAILLAIDSLGGCKIVCGGVVGRVREGSGGSGTTREVAGGTGNDLDK
jgi:hypothetical protein